MSNSCVKKSARYLCSNGFYNSFCGGVIFRVNLTWWFTPKKTLPNKHARNLPIGKIETWKFSTAQPDSVKLLCKKFRKITSFLRFLWRFLQRACFGGETRKKQAEMTLSWSTMFCTCFKLSFRNFRTKFCHDYIEQLNFVIQVCLLFQNNLDTPAKGILFNIQCCFKIFQIRYKKVRHQVQNPRFTIKIGMANFGSKIPKR